MITHPAFFVDGESAGRFVAELRAEGPDLVILRDEGADVVRWPLSDILALRDQGGRDQLILRLPEGAPGAAARVVVEDPAAIDWILTICPGLNRAVIDPMGLRRIGLWSVGALVSVLLLIFVIIPGLSNWLAPLIPPEAEARFGVQIRDQSAAMFAPNRAGKRFCVDPAGLAALDTLVARLTQDQDLPHDLKLSVIDSNLVNAFAVPGGYVTVLRGLIDQAESADEVAGVLAHEIGHVAARDPTRLALRSAGSAGILAMVIGDVMGASVVATVATKLIQASYTRDAESAADAYAVRMLDQAAVPPGVLADFFDRLAERETQAPGGLDLFRSHPDLKGRSATIRDGAEPGRGRPILTEREWQALQSVCRRRGPPM